MVRQLGPELKALAERENERAAKQMATMMKSIAPHQTGVLDSTITATPVGDGGWMVSAGGPATTDGAFDYARLIEFGARNRDIEDPYYRPSRRRVRRLHKQRLWRGHTAIAKRYSGARS